MEILKYRKRRTKPTDSDSFPRIQPKARNDIGNVIRTSQVANIYYLYSFPLRLRALL
jgi:hypothetical protein